MNGENNNIQVPTSENSSDESKNEICGKAMPLYYFTIIFTVLCMLVQSLAVLFGYDTVMQVYKHGSVLGAVAGAVIFVSVAVLALISFYVTRSLKGLTELPPITNLNAFISVTTGVFVVVSSIMMYVQARTVGGTVTTVAIAACGLSIPCGAYYVFSGMKRENKQLLLIFGFFPVLWTAACLLRIYFEVGAAINDPVRILLQISFVSIMLAMLFELKTRIGKQGTTMYVMLSCLSVVLGCSSALSVFLLFIIPRTVTFAELLLTVAQLLMSLYILARLNTNLKHM